jgi:Flp pilus assembly protein TadD
LDPENSASRIDLGLTQARQGNSAEAIIQIRQAILRDRQNPEAHRVLAAIFVNLGRLREAAAEVLRLRPDHAEARAFMAMARCIYI